MNIVINQTTTKILDEKRLTVLDIAVFETYVLTPDPGKALRNKKTGRIYKGTTSVGPYENIALYEEIGIPKEPI